MEDIPKLTKTIWNGIAFLDEENKDLTDNDPAKIKPAIQQEKWFFCVFEWLLISQGIFFW